MYLQSFVVLLFRLLELLILIRVVVSWINPNLHYYNPLLRLVWDITEPILGPLRRYAVFGMADFSPFIALLLLEVLQSIILQLLAR